MKEQGLFAPRRLPALIATLGVLGCRDSPLEVTGRPSQTFSIEPGRELEITLGTVGPGKYASPPEVSSTAVRFLDMQFVDPVPAGPRQRYRFEAVRAGISVIVFRHTIKAEIVEDTVQVH